jgi:hypothetical protein
MSEDLKQKFIGTWRLLSIERIDTASGARTDQMGANPIGYLSYAPDDRMMAIIERGDRTKPAGDAATPVEADALYRSVISYGGTWRIEGDTMIHSVDVSWNEAWTGTEQKRLIKFDGEHAVLSTHPIADPFDGSINVYSMRWERVR